MPTGMERVNDATQNIAQGFGGMTQIPAAADQFAQMIQWLKNLIPAQQDPNAGLVASPGMMQGQPGAQPMTRGQLHQQMTTPRK